MSELTEGETVKIVVNGRELVAKVGYRKPWESFETLKSLEPAWKSVD